MDRTKFGVNYTDEADGSYYRGTFEAAMSSNPDWLHIYTFNELAEFSHIEATFEHGYKYINLTAEFVRNSRTRNNKKKHTVSEVVKQCAKTRRRIEKEHETLNIMPSALAEFVKAIRAENLT